MIKTFLVQLLNFAICVSILTTSALSKAKDEIESSTSPAASSPKEQMLNTLEALRKILSTDMHQDEYINMILKEDVRYLAFQLQELAKAYSRIDDDKESKKMDEAEDLATDLENAMGAYAFAFEMNEFFHKWFPIWIAQEQVTGAEAEKLKALMETSKKRERQAADHFYDWLKKAGWTAPDKKDGPFAKMKEIINEFKWPSAAEDRSLIMNYTEGKLSDLELGLIVTEYIRDRGWSSDDLSKEQEKTLKRLFGKDALKNIYDPKVVEAGIHELRRDVRRIVMIFQFMWGYFATADRPSRPIIAQFLQGYEDSKYSKLRDMSERVPVQISAEDFKAIIYAVKKLGYAKDNGQTQEDIEGLLHEVFPDGEKHEHESFARKLISLLPFGQTSYVQISEEVLDFFNTSQLITEIKEVIRNDRNTGPCGELLNESE